MSSITIIDPTKPRTKSCDIDRVEFAFNTLVYIIKHSPKLLK